MENGRAKLGAISRLVLQPNNREDELRSWLVSNGFRLLAEDILEEAGKFYEILVAEAGQQTLTEQEKRFGPFLLEQQSPVFQLRWQKELKKLEGALVHIPEKNELERSVMSKKIESIKEVLHVSK